MFTSRGPPPFGGSVHASLFGRDSRVSAKFSQLFTAFSVCVAVELSIGRFVPALVFLQLYICARPGVFIVWLIFLAPFPGSSVEEFALPPASLHGCAVFGSSVSSMLLGLSD